MKLTRENFMQPIKCGLVTLLLVLPMNAAEQEIWYDSDGNPILAKDKKTGLMRVITVEELAAMNKTEEKAVAPPAVDKQIEIEDPKPAAEMNDSPTPAPSSLVTDRNSVIPMILAPKIYADNRYYPSKNNHHYSPSYFSTYPYISRPVVPRFSNNGYYQPAQYYRPHYNNYHHGNHGYHRNYNNHNNCGNGFLLRYSRPGLNIRARF